MCVISGKVREETLLLHPVARHDASALFAPSAPPLRPAPHCPSAPPCHPPVAVDSREAASPHRSHGWGKGEGRI